MCRKLFYSPVLEGHSYAGVERPDLELFDAAALVGHLVPPGSMFAFLARHRAEVFPDEDFADLFTPR